MLSALNYNNSETMRVLDCLLDFSIKNETNKFEKNNKLNVNFKGELTQTLLIKKLEQYKYGIISYIPINDNNDLCAPVKLFDYLISGCIIISVYKNKALC